MIGKVNRELEEDPAQLLLSFSLFAPAKFSSTQIPDIFGTKVNEEGCSRLLF